MHGDCVGNNVEDYAELAVVDPDDDRAARVCAAGLGPAARDRGEVVDVARDEHSFFFCRKRQQLFVRIAVQLALLGDGTDVVTCLTERHGDALRRYVCVEENPHEASGARSGGNSKHRNGRIFLFQLVYRSLVISDYGVDLFGEHLVVVERKLDLALVDGPTFDDALHRADVLVDIEWSSTFRRGGAASRGD
jgi:hypothetical protein